MSGAVAEMKMKTEYQITAKQKAANENIDVKEDKLMLKRKIVKIITTRIWWHLPGIKK